MPTHGFLIEINIELTNLKLFLADQTLVNVTVVVVYSTQTVQKPSFEMPTQPNIVLVVVKHSQPVKTVRGLIFGKSNVTFEIQ